MRWLCLVLAAGCYDLDAVVRPLDLDGPASDGAADAPSLDGAPDAPLDDYAMAVMADSPLAYWRLADVGSTAADTAGNHDGTYAGSCSRGAPGIVPTNTAVDFDGCYIVIADASDFDFVGMAPFSVEFWLYREGWADEFAMGFVRPSPDPFSPGSNPEIMDGYFLAIQHDLGNFSRCRGGGCETANTLDLALGAWHHVVAVYDGTGNADALRVYVDAALGPSPGSGGIQLLDIDTPLYLGDPRAADPLVGRVDEIAIYPVALTLTQIQTHRGAVDL